MSPMVEPDESISLEAELREANRCLSIGDTSAALAILEPLIADDTVGLPARFLLSMAAWKMGRLDWAVMLMRECHERWPMHGTVAEALASLYAQAGNLHESLFMGKLATALAGRREFIEFVPPGFPSFGWAFQHIKDNPKLSDARASLAAGNLRDAVEHARQHAALNPETEDAQAFYAEMLLRVDAAGAAVEVLRPFASQQKPTASFASLYARVLAAVGELGAAQAWHEKAALLAPDDAEITAARVADGVWLDGAEWSVVAAGKEWAQRFCASPETRKWNNPDGKLVIGYIVSAFCDPLDAGAIAAVARGHDRKRVTVIGYGSGAQSWDANLPFQGVFDRWQDIGALDAATLVRFFERDGLHVIIDGAGFAAPRGLMALARLRTAIRIAWLGNSGNLGQPVYDAQIAARSTEALDASSWRIAGGYPIRRLAARPQRVIHEGVNFGADARMAQFDAETVRLWSSVLQAQPDAKLLLRAHDMAAGGNVGRLIARFGRDLAARIDVVEVERLEEFYSIVDVALTPRRGISPRMAAEALACGVPVVAMAAQGVNEPYGAFLRDLGLGAALVAADEEEYVNIARTLATSEKAHAQATAAMSAFAKVGEDRAEDFARALEEQAIKAMALATDIAS